jgi:hypothetical protein
MKPTGRTSMGLIFIIAMLGVVLMMTIVLSSTKVVPYNSMSKHASVEEGFTQPVHYAKYADGSSIDVKDSHLINSTTSDPASQRVTNMQGLFGPENVSQKLDIYSDATSGLSKECESNSFGLSNSRGYLCLDAGQRAMITTRGGNQTAE